MAVFGLKSKHAWQRVDDSTVAGLYDICTDLQYRFIRFTFSYIYVILYIIYHTRKYVYIVQFDFEIIVVSDIFVLAKKEVQTYDNVWINMSAKILNYN